ncbi:MFS transporter [Kribbella sp. NPDC056861]|uniref:MFS transporter n=1 Tax=Kribbella sp. NPDC056861 TaxID=3154857 RepID=UPI00343E878D
MSTSEIAGRIERLPSSRWHLLVRLLIGAATLFDGFDQLLVSYAMPLLRREWQLDQQQVTLLITVGGLGMLIGAVVAGLLADRIGRVRVLMLCIFVYSATSLLMAATRDLTTFLVLRYVQGLGIGGEVLVAAVYVNEIIGARRRGRFVLRYELVFAAGLLCAAAASAWVIPHWGWRPLFVVGGLPIALVGALWRYVPESPRWLASRGHPAADETMARIEAAVRSSATGPVPEPVVVSADQFTPRRSYPQRFAVLAVFCFCAFLVNYALSSWMPTIYTGLFDVPLAEALRYSLYAMIGGFAGAAVLALFADRVDRRTALVVGAIGASVVLFRVAFAGGADTVGGLVLSVCVTSFFISATNLGVYLYVPELFPTRMRALGSGLAGIFIRLGVIVGPLLVGLLATDAPAFRAAVGILSCAAFVAAAVLFLFGDETRCRQLEEVSP